MAKMKIKYGPHGDLDRRRIMVGLYNSGMGVRKIANQMDISPQAVSQQIKKARRDGWEVSDPHPHQPPTLITFACKLCGRERTVTAGNNKSTYCSPECGAKSRIKKEAKWSRHGLVTQVCDGCGVTFTRTANRVSIYKSHGSTHTYCSKECYWTNRAKRPSRRQL